MKKLIISVMFLAAAALIFAGGGRDGVSIGFPVRGNGKLVTSELSVSPFERLNVQESVVVNYHESTEYRAVVTVDSNLEEYVSIYNQGDTLRIGTKRGRIYRFTNYTVDVYAPLLSSVSVSGSVIFEAVDKIKTQKFDMNISGNARVRGSFECDDFSIRVSGSADINSRIECKRFKTNISGSGDMALSGNADDMELVISGFGNFNAGEFRTNNAVVQISGSGRINIWAEETLKANVSGSGRLIYRGNPKIDYRGSGSGRLERV